jgi:agmatinase
MESPLEPPGSPLLRDPGDERIPWTPKPGASIALVGIPWDWSAAGVPGARLAPQRIRVYLKSLRTHAPGMGGSFPCAVRDLGDVRVAPGDYEVTAARIAEAAGLAYREGVVAAFLGGDHSITRWTLEPLLSKGEPVALVMLDAHYDMRSVSEGRTSGSWLWDLVKSHPGKVKAAIIGVADYSNPPYLQDRAREAGFLVVPRLELLGGVEPALDAIDRLAGEASVGYITIDMDHLDQAYAPGVNSPTPLGMTPVESLGILRHATRRLKPLGVDVVEVTPTVDTADATSRLAARLLAYTLHEACLARLG